MTETIINVPGRFNPIEYGTPLANASDIYDENNQKTVQETLNDENNKIASQDTKIDMLNTAGEYIEHSEGYLVKAYNIGDIFYKIEYARDIQIKHYYVARVNGFAGDQITDTEKFIDAGTSSVNALNIKTTIIKGALQGDDAYGVYVKQWKEDNPNLEPTTENGFLERDEWLESLVGDNAYEIAVEEGFEGSKSDWLEHIRGKSAKEIYNSVYGTSYNDAQFINAIKANYQMKYIEYNSTAYSATSPFNSIDSLDADETTEGKLWFMPNDDNTETKLFITINNGTIETPNYKWYNMGVVDVPSNILTEEMVDNECTNGTVDTPASANFVMGLARKLQGVTFEETKAENLEDYTNGGSYSGYYTIGTNGEAVWNETSTGNYKSTRIDVHEYNSVRFLGYAVKNTTVCYCFQDSNGDVITSTLKQYKDTTLESGVTILREYTINVPSDAYYLVCCYKNGSNGVLQPSNFYCYLQSGDTVKDMVNELDDKLYGYDIINTSTPSINSTWGFVKSSDAEDLVTNDVDDYILRQTSPNASYSKSVTSYYGKKIRITAGQYDAYYAFSKKAWSGIGTYLTLQDAIDNDIFSEVHHTNDGWVNCFKINANETVIIDIPSDAYNIYLVGKIIRSNDYGQEDITRLPNKIEILETSGDIASLNNSINEINENISSIDDSITTLDEEVYGVDVEEEINGFTVASVLQGACGSGGFERPAAAGNYMYAIKLDGYTKVDIEANRSCYLCITKKRVDKTTSIANMNSLYVDSDCYNDVRNIEYKDDKYRLVIPANTEATIYLSPASKWLYIQKQWKNYSSPEPSSVTLYEKKKAGGLVELRNAIADNTNVISSSISFSNGRIGTDGKFIEDYNYVTSNPIPLDKGCLIMVNDDYRICAAHLFDNNGNLVNHREYFRSDQSTFGGDISYPLAIVLQQYNVRLTFMKRNDVANPNDSIIRYFCYLNDSRLIRKTPSNEEIIATINQYKIDNPLVASKIIIPNNFDIEKAYPIAYSRAKTLLNVLWTPVKDAIMHYDADNYAKEGQVMHGIPYSVPQEYSKLVGAHVSIRTFLSAVLNPRSVVYTEKVSLSNHDTKYDIEYHGSDFAISYYGDVCASFVGYVAGLYFHMMANMFSYISGMVNLLGYKGTDMQDESNGNYFPHNQYGTITIDGVEKDPFDIIQPLDIPFYHGHIMIVTDVYTDEYGNNKIIIITEETTPRVRSTAYTKESFRRRFGTLKEGKDWTIYRYLGWNANTGLDNTTIEYEGTDKLVQKDFFNYTPENTVSIDKDIQCFAGDYAAFAIGNPNQTVDEYNNNKMFLNIHKGTDSEAYNTLQIFAEEDDETEDSPTYSISLSDTSYISASNIYTNDSEEGWVIADIAKYWWNEGDSFPHGKYKARVVRIDNGNIQTREEDGSDIASGFVHFEMVKIEFFVTGNSKNYSFRFDTSGLPITIHREKRDGNETGGQPAKLRLTNDYTYDSTTGIYSANNIVKDWEYDSQKNFAKLYVRGEYGVVVRKVLLPQ